MSGVDLLWDLLIILNVQTTKPYSNYEGPAIKASGEKQASEALFKVIARGAWDEVFELTASFGGLVCLIEAWDGARGIPYELREGVA